MSQSEILGFLKRATHRSARVEEYCVSLERNGITERITNSRIFPCRAGARTATILPRASPRTSPAGSRPATSPSSTAAASTAGASGARRQTPPPRVELQDALWAAVRKRGSAWFYFLFVNFSLSACSDQCQDRALSRAILPRAI